LYDTTPNTARNAAAMLKCASGVRLYLAASPPAAAPSIPPTLHTPWNEDMIGLLQAFSTSTACAFMATSITPIATP